MYITVLSFSLFHSLNRLRIFRAICKTPIQSTLKVLFFSKRRLCPGWIDLSTSRLSSHRRGSALYMESLPACSHGVSTTQRALAEKVPRLPSAGSGFPAPAGGRALFRRGRTRPSVLNFLRRFLGRCSPFGLFCLRACRQDIPALDGKTRYRVAAILKRLFAISEQNMDSALFLASPA